MSGRQAQRRRPHLLQELRLIKEKTADDPLKVFRSDRHVKPSLEVKSRRSAARTTSPGRGNPNRRLSLTYRWIVGYATSRRRQDDQEKLARTARRCEPSRRAVKKREDTHRMAEANKAFAH